MNRWFTNASSPPTEHDDPVVTLGEYTLRDYRKMISPRLASGGLAVDLQLMLIDP
jgi:hypothetical protein